jgi:hypothetical protein
MASVPSVTSTLAGLQSALTTIAVSETTAATNGANPLSQPSGEVTVDFYQSANDAQAAQILGTVGWKPYSNSYDETATLAVVNNGSTQSYIGTYSDRYGGAFGSAAWDTSTALDDPTQGLTPAYAVLLERESADSLSATITAADGTTSKIELSAPESASSPTATSPPSPPATASAPAPVAPPPAPITLSDATKAPHPPQAAIRATTIVSGGSESLSLTFNVNGDYNALFTSTNLGVTSFVEAGASYGSVLAVTPGSKVNVSG